MTKARDLGVGVTTSSTDTAAGRLLKVGDFGVGALIVEYSDANNLIKSGLYVTGAATLNNPSTNGVYISVNGNFVNGGSQTAFDVVTNKIYFRTLLSGTWSPWQELYHTGNTVGTVSQSGGLPTGAIIERGSNANGEYVKYADGTLICTGSASGTTNTLYDSENYFVAVNGTYPSVFSATPKCMSTATNLCDSTLFTNSTTGVSFRVHRRLNGASFDVHWTAIGRWF